MTGRKKEAGNVGEILTIGLCILALTALMISYMENVQLIAKKAEVGQLARCYLLKMETVGYLAAQDQTQLTAELENLGMTGIDYEGSTLQYKDVARKIEKLHILFKNAEIEKGDKNSIFGKLLGSSLNKKIDDKIDKIQLVSTGGFDIKLKNKNLRLNEIALKNK